MPKIIYLTVNNRCNLRCCMCDIGQRNTNTNFFDNLIKDDILTLDQWKVFLDSIKGFSPQIYIVGTEPLLYNQVGELVDYAKSLGLYVCVGTNGFLLEKFASVFIDSGLDEISISLDGPEPIHDTIRGVTGVYKRVISGIQKLQALEPKGKHIKLKINCCISNYNYDCLKDFFAEITDTIRIDEITFSHLNFITREMSERHNVLYPSYPVTSSSIDAVNPAKVDCSILWNNICAIMQQKTSINVGFIPNLESEEMVFSYYNEPEKIIKNQQCYVPWISSSIQANGDVIVLARCGISIEIGNIRKVDFAILWRGDTLKSFREDLQKHKMFPACTRCCGVLS